MNQVFGVAALCLLALILALAAVDAVVRFAARKRERATGRFGPAAEAAIAGYLASGEPPPAVSDSGERAIVLQVGIDALGDLQGSERDRLASMLDRLGFVSEAQVRLGSRRRAVRRGAAETLAVIGTAGARSARSPALADRDVLVRNTAARVLAQTGDDEAIAAVIAVAESDVDRAPGAVSATVLALGRCKPAAIEAMLASGVRPELKAIAIAAAGELRLASCGSALLACLTERDDVAAAAATALGSIADPAAVPALETLLRSDSWPLRAAAAGGLRQLGTAGRDALARASASVLPDVRDAARTALAS